MAIRIEQQTRVVASGDYCMVELNHATGKVTVSSITLANADELEAFGEALVDVADMLRGKAPAPPHPGVSVVDEFNRIAVEAARTAAKVGASPSLSALAFQPNQ